MPHQAPTPDEELLQQRVASARGRVVSAKTAQAIAAWLSEGIGPGFQTFQRTGLVTRALYTELARLYDQRRPEVEHWLDTLTRYCLRQTVANSEDDDSAGDRPEDRE